MKWTNQCEADEMDESGVEKKTELKSWKGKACASSKCLLALMTFQAINVPTKKWR